MPVLPLSPVAQRRLAVLLSGADLEPAKALLEREVGRNLPLCDSSPPEAIDRLRHAVMKVSEGRLDLLRQAIALAKRYWRDLLVSAGFAHDVHAHLHWEPGPHPNAS